MEFVEVLKDHAEHAWQQLKTIDYATVSKFVSDTRERGNTLLSGIEPLQLVVLSVCVYILLAALAELLFQEEPLWRRLVRGVLRFVKGLPIVRTQIRKLMEKNWQDMERDICKPIKGVEASLQLPKKGLDPKEIEARLEKLGAAGNPEKRRKEGKVSGTIYVGGPRYERLTELLTHTYGKFAWSNPLHTSVFPGVQRMEAEIIAMTAHLFGGDGETCGNVTSGGTESIFLAMKTYRDWAKSTKGITKGNIVACRTAHPAFNKAAQYLGLTLRLVDEDRTTFRARPAAMAAAIDSNTVCVVGSCIQFPHGVADPIIELAKIAQRAGVGLHVDSCLGSFIVPFLREVGRDFADFDFRLPGVTSISVDTHKFGMAPKGSSVVLYKSKALRKHQYAIFPDWPGGIYGTPGAAGSRPGALLAATWAALMFFGRDGYRRNCQEIIKATDRLVNGIKRIKELNLLCEPDASVVAFDSKSFDINRMVHPLTSPTDGKGWDVNVIQFPSAIHICVTLAHTADGVIDNLLRDLQDVASELAKNPKAKAEGAGAMYGMSQAVPDRSIIEDLVVGAIDCMSKVQADGKF